MLDQDWAIDITVAHPGTARHVRDEADTPGAAATHLEANKHRLYGLTCRKHNIQLHLLGIDKEAVLCVVLSSSLLSSLSLIDASSSLIFDRYTLMSMQHNRLQYVRKIRQHNFQ